ncbi:hypothetical protein BDV38DRAFT_278475 [Aspergillus pseudotamarii]|uniref:MYND-type domain-containing protein n=1 Tax=Aspergillus pseudotamarii TaxID=132259 RepID=A0A5N6T7S2_ASPPS|nr:uncharacterized protein BDV38DRAFT_278475 [Aspergillus pseudotamarii]KAE8142310.1 hypothetical protein BDV38DRAFT_278475 [Aspergillus pseudotamarii]
MDTPPSSARSCAHCHSPATKRCSGCLGAPEYDEAILEPTLYCSPTCQTQHWIEHKIKCKQLQARKSLSRAATLFQAVLYRIRLHAHTIQSAIGHMDGSRVILRPVKEVTPKAYRPLGPPSIELKGGDQRVFDAIVMMGSCTEAIMFLYVFVRDILSSLCSRIEELTIEILNKEISIENPDGIPLTHTNNHHVYRVTLNNEEIWVIDPSGAQYGFSECLYTWSEFKKHRLGKIHREANLGYHRVEIPRSCLQLNDRCMVIWWMELFDLSSALEKKISTLSNVYGGNLELILQGSDAEFQKAKNELLDKLGICIDLCLDEAFAPERIAQRSLLVDGRLALERSNS